MGLHRKIRGWSHKPYVAHITFSFGLYLIGMSGALESQGGMPSGYPDSGSQSVAPAVFKPFGGSGSAATAGQPKPKGMQLGKAKKANDILDAMAKVSWSVLW